MRPSRSRVYVALWLVVRVCSPGSRATTRVGCAVVALAATNVVSVVLFGALYLRRVRTALAGGLPGVPRRHLRARDRSVGARRGAASDARVVRRLGRVVIGLAAVVLATPLAVLMPLFWLDTQLPAEAGLHRLLAPIMTLVLIALVLVVLSTWSGVSLLPVPPSRAGRAWRRS